MIAAIALALFCFIAAMAVGLIPFIGSSQPHHPHLKTMTALAGGFLIGAALLIAIPEGMALFIQPLHPTVHFFDVGLALLLGFLFMLLLETFGFSHDIHEEHHDHVDEHGHSHINHPEAGLPYAVVGLTIHAMIDGMIIGIALAQEAIALSVALIVAITMHKLPAAFSVSAFSLHQRNNRRGSLLDLFLFSVSTPVAILIFYWLAVDIPTDWQGLAMLFSAGTFLYVACVDVLPSVHEPNRSLRVVWPVILGVAAVLMSVTLVEGFAGGAH